MVELSIDKKYEIKKSYLLIAAVLIIGLFLYGTGIFQTYFFAGVIAGYLERDGNKFTVYGSATIGNIGRESFLIFDADRCTNECSVCNYPIWYSCWKPCNEIYEGKRVVTSNLILSYDGKTHNIPSSDVELITTRDYDYVCCGGMMCHGKSWQFIIQASRLPEDSRYATGSITGDFSIGTTEPCSEGGERNQVCISDTSLTKEVCVSGEWATITDECGIDEVCKDGVFVSGCLVDGQCTDDEICSNNACIKLNCPTGQIARNHQCVNVMCMNGEKKQYTCPDNTKVNWCTCVNHEWDCITSPEMQCPGYCSNDLKCDDNDVCTEESCLNNFCVYTETPNCCYIDADCNDNNDMTIDSCTNNRCVYEEVPVDWFAENFMLVLIIVIIIILVIVAIYVTMRRR